MSDTPKGDCDACDRGYDVPRSHHGLDCPKRKTKREKRATRAERERPPMPDKFVTRTNVMTPVGVQAVITWEVNGMTYMAYGFTLELAMAAAAQLEADRLETA